MLGAWADDNVKLGVRKVAVSMTADVDVNSAASTRCAVTMADHIAIAQMIFSALLNETTNIFVHCDTTFSIEL